MNGTWIESQIRLIRLTVRNMDGVQNSYLSVGFWGSTNCKGN